MRYTRTQERIIYRITPCARKITRPRIAPTSARAARSARSRRAMETSRSTRADRSRASNDVRTLNEKPPCENARGRASPKIARGRVAVVSAPPGRRRIAHRARDDDDTLRRARTRERRSTRRRRTHVVFAHRTRAHVDALDARRTHRTRAKTRPGTRSRRAAEFLDVPSERVFEDDARCLPRRRRT